MFTKRNLGYAFVNFSDSHEVLKLFLEVGTRKAFESRWTGSYGQIRIALSDSLCVLRRSK